MSNNELAFFVGLLGSLHCIGMCGPLAFAVPVTQSGWFPLLRNKLVYQLGRIFSYMLLGVIAGLLGRQIWQAGLQQGISILTGFLILLAAISRIAKFNWSNNTQKSYFRPFYRLFDYAFKHKANHLIIGMLNGLLPCGFVYLALAGAINIGNITGSVSYMFWFGAGTVPLMLAATVIVGFSSAPFRKKLNKIVPFAMLFLGAWFLLRGLELNIPYLSPQMPNSEVSVCK